MILCISLSILLYLLLCCSLYKYCKALSFWDAALSEIPDEGAAIKFRIPLGEQQQGRSTAQFL